MVWGSCCWAREHRFCSEQSQLNRDMLKEGSQMYRNKLLPCYELRNAVPVFCYPLVLLLAAESGCSELRALGDVVFIVCWHFLMGTGCCKGARGTEFICFGAVLRRLSAALEREKVSCKSSETDSNFLCCSKTEPCHNVYG